MNTKKVLGIILALVMCLTLNPLPTYAAEAESQGVGSAEAVEAESVETFYIEIIDQPTLNPNAASLLGGLSAAQRNLKAAGISLVGCNIKMGYNSSGLHVEYTTGCSTVAEEVGIKDIKIQKKVGIFWTTIATSSGAYCLDSSTFAGSSDHTGLDLGATYRVCATHYAYAGGYSESLDAVTDGHKYNY